MQYEWLHSNALIHVQTTNESLSPRKLSRGTRCYFNVRSKADISQLNLPHGKLIYREGLCNHRRWIVCLFVTTITKYNVDGSGRNFLGRFLGGKASPSSFLVTIASRVWRLLSKNAVNRGFFSSVNKPISNVNKPTNHLTHNK